MSILILNYIVLLVSAFVTAQVTLYSDAFISMINSKQNTWKAGRNFHRNVTLENALINLINNNFIENPPTLEIHSHHADLIASLPHSFDSRKKWPDCRSLGEIRDQGQCASGWAYAAVEVMTDRMCVYSNGTQHFRFSADDLIYCGNFVSGFCTGGSQLDAWMYWKSTGIVSGGAYNTSQGCRSSVFPPCEGGPLVNCTEISRPGCVQKCEDGYSVEYTLDKHRGKTVYQINGEDNMQAELYTNGPIATAMAAFEDFFHYKSGVYTHTVGDFLGTHAIKILGWGIENGTKYWLCANSWSTTWGDEGFFKILRGENHAGIERSCFAGEPDLI